MKALEVGLFVWLLTGMFLEPARATCAGDCGGDGKVTVDEILLGVNLALSGAQADPCPALDTNHNNTVTVDEILTAVNNALGTCPTGNFAGEYSATLTFDATHTGTIELTAESNGSISGSLMVTTPSSHALRFHPEFSFTFPTNGVSVELTGTYDPAAGGFEVTGSFVDANGQTVPVDISGDLPGPTGNATVNVYVGTDPPFTATLSAGMIVTPTPTPSPTPGPASEPRIVYAGSIADPHIFVINSNGTGLTKLTNSSGVDSNPAWSPDGTKIAFSTPFKTGIGIAVMTATGNDVQVLTTEDSPLNFFPAWSPNGDRIVFTAGSGDAIDVMDANGLNRHRLVTKSAGESYRYLRWSPDGARITFESTRPRQSGSDTRLEIWVMDADGSNFVRLTNNEVADVHPDWSPDGQKIVFQRNPSISVQPGIFTINPNGSGETRLLLDPFGFTAPNWSQDGQQLAYSSFIGIKIVNANGANAVTVPNTAFLTDFDFK